MTDPRKDYATSKLCALALRHGRAAAARGLTPLDSPYSGPTLATAWQTGFQQWSDEHSPLDDEPTEPGADTTP